MTLSNSQLQERLEALESIVNDLQTAVDNLATKRQLKQLLAVLRPEISDLSSQVDQIRQMVGS